MLDPRYIDDLPASIVALYRQAEDAILQDMARKLDAYDYWMPAVEWQNQKLRQAGEVQETIISELAKISKKSEDELRRLMSDAGSLALKLDAEVYNNAGLQVPDFNMAEPLRKVLNAGYQQTAGTMRNLTRSTATAAQQQFFDAADLAWAKIQSGAIDYTTAIREAIKSLADKGIASIRYPGGYTDYMDVAVRRAVVTGINQTACKLSEELADELECDLVEVSAHSGARPSHAEWQGKIYSRSGKSEKYPEFRTSTGYGTGAGLGGWNCRHSFGPYVEGSPRIWSDKELEKLNAKDYEYNGEAMTEYEATQKQRYFERQIRKAKREEIALEAAGQDASEAKGRVAYYQKKQADFLDQTGLKRQYERENVYGKALKSSPKPDKITGEMNPITGAIEKVLDGTPSAKEKHYADIVSRAIKSGVEYRPVHMQSRVLSNDEIIAALAGGDLTRGSCASLGLAYIGQQQGWDVLDYRDGNSRSMFSNGLMLYDMSFANGVSAIHASDVAGKTSVTISNNFLKTVQTGREYYLCVGRHAAVVRRTEAGALEYLELQSARYSGWTPFDGNPRYTLINRFGCSSSSGHGERYDFMIDITGSSFDNDDFRTVLGFINTEESKQRKGKYGAPK